MIRSTKKIVKDNPTQVYFNPEQPYIEVLGVESNYSSEELKSFEILLHLKSIDFDDNEANKVYDLNLDFDNDNGNILTPDQERIIEVNKNTKELLAYYTFKNIKTIPKNEDLYFKLNFQLIDRIKSENQHHLFKNHLSQSDNLKIMFSAPFGHGKSTFLEYFFKDETEQYDVIKLTPINYSVASNEDIFKYIKSDILIQLMEKGLDYESNKTSHLNSLLQFSKNNLERILVPFLLTVPHIGKSLYSVTKDILKLKDEFFDFHDENNESEFIKASKFIEELYEKEGSIYEDNFYSQLIRQLLEVLKLKTNKQSVLIIHDLDRMDPEHIFRILNILSVHFDSFNQEELEVHNKFGFDKIILVCDYENIRKIYEHKYGEGVDFGGYINKYYSKEVYHFNYKNEVEHILQKIDKNTPTNSSLNNLYEAFYDIANSLFQAKLLSLRDIYKLRNKGLFNSKNNIYKSNNAKNEYFYYGLYSPIIKVFTDVLGASIFKAKIDSLNSNYLIKTEINIKYSCLELIGSYQASSYNKVIRYKYKDHIYTINFEIDTRALDSKIIDIKPINLNTEDLNLPSDIGDSELFKLLLIKNIEKYEIIKSDIL